MTALIGRMRNLVAEIRGRIPHEQRVTDVANVSWTATRSRADAVRKTGHTEYASTMATMLLRKLMIILNIFQVFIQKKVLINLFSDGRECSATRRTIFYVFIMLPPDFHV